MTHRWLVITVCVLMSAPSVFAQSRDAKAKPDPITGTWTGELAPQNAPRRMPVTMELKFDGKKAVSGTVSGLPNPADVKSGTFDPKTGALKLELGKKGETEVLLVLDGTVVKGTATGKVTGEGAGGDFKIAKKP
jgi:hypothetical protein